MGGQPLTALATAVVPFAIEEKMEADLMQVLLGAKKVRFGICRLLQSAFGRSSMMLAAKLSVDILQKD